MMYWMQWIATAQAQTILDSASLVAMSKKVVSLTLAGINVRVVEHTRCMGQKKCCCWEHTVSSLWDIWQHLSIHDATIVECSLGLLAAILVSNLYTDRRKLPRNAGVPRSSTENNSGGNDAPLQNDLHLQR